MGFYQEWIPLFEIRIARWRKYIKEAEKDKSTTQDDFLAKIWSPQDTALRLQLLNEIKEKPCLARPNINRRFYLKTDWSKHGKAAVLLQADLQEPAALEAEDREDQGGKCEFDKTVTNLQLRLLPVVFISQRNSKTEESWHSFLGEAATGLWAMKKLRRWLIGKTFTWMTDCSGLEQFFESDSIPTHFAQRVRVQLLNFNFTIAHRPNKMMKEVDTLNRYNFWTMQWRTEPDISKESVENPKHWSALIATANQPTPTKFSMPISGYPMSNLQPHEVGGLSSMKTPLASVLDHSRRAWIFDAQFSPVRAVSPDLNAQILESALIDDHTNDEKYVSSTRFTELLTGARRNDRVDWIIARPSAIPDKITSQPPNDDSDYLQALLAKAKRDHHVKAVILYEPSHDEAFAPNLPLYHLFFNKIGWTSIDDTIENTTVGGAIHATFRILIAAPSKNTIAALTERVDNQDRIKILKTEPSTLQEHLDPNTGWNHDAVSPECANHRLPIVIDGNGIHANKSLPVLTVPVMEPGPSLC